MTTKELFSLVKTVMCEFPDEEIIKDAQKTLAYRYLQLKLDPFIYANGSVPKGAYRAEEITQGRKLRVEIYQVNERVKSFDIYSFLAKRRALNLGGLGLVLLERFFPYGISCIAFESGDSKRMTSVTRVIEGGYQFMILKAGITFDESDGFVCIAQVPDDE